MYALFTLAREYTGCDTAGNSIINQEKECTESQISSVIADMKKDDLFIYSVLEFTILLI